MMSSVQLAMLQRYCDRILRARDRHEPCHGRARTGRKPETQSCSQRTSELALIREVAGWPAARNDLLSSRSVRELDVAELGRTGGSRAAPLRAAAVGAVVGVLFPPAIIRSAIAGAAVGGVGGHLWRGMSRADVKELGEVIDAGQAALVIVRESKLGRRWTRRC